MDANELERRRAESRAMWSAGHYPTVASHIVGAAERLVSDARIGPGDRVLDVATGSGSVALSAARAGATVVGVDQIDTWFSVPRAAAHEEDLQVELLVGQAEDLPVDDMAFDAVLSSFGHIFAPRHDVVAAEMVRACRPGGVVACTAWAHDRDEDDSIFGVVERYLGADQVPSSADWGDPDHLCARFAVHGVAMDVRRHVVTWRFPSVDAHWEFLLTASGPYQAVRAALEAEGVWDEALAEMQELDRRDNTAADGAYAMDQEYLLAIGTRAT